MKAEFDAGSKSMDVMGLPQVIQVSVYSQWEHWEHLGYPQKLGNPKIRCFQISRCVNQAATLDIQNQIWDVQIWSGGWWRKSFARRFTSVVLQIRKYGVFCLKPGSWGLPPRSQPSRCRQRSAGGNEKKTYGFCCGSKRKTSCPLVI